MDTTMADEFYERYRHLTHQELYRMLHNGSVAQVAKVADTWASIADTLAGLSAALRRDLDRLQPDWTGRGSRDFHFRLDLVTRYAQTLADESAAIRGGLNAMAHSLREAQRRAETPQVASDGEASFSYDGVLGSALGRMLPAEQQASAHERMVQVVSQLAADYGVADHGNWPVALPDAPLEMPVVDAIVGLATDALDEDGAGGTTLAAARSLMPAAPPIGMVAAEAHPAGATTAAGVAPIMRVETLRGGHTPVLGHAAIVDEPATRAGQPPAPATSPGAAAAPMASPMGMAPAGMTHVSVPSEAVAWRAADNMDWAEDDSETPPGVLGD